MFYKYNDFEILDWMVTKNAGTSERTEDNDARCEWQAEELYTSLVVYRLVHAPVIR